ncbi:MAG: 30S ribosomal protein S7 [Minisyncoccia bacterium]
MRRPIKKRPPTKKDPIYGTENTTRLINYVMEEGKKATARAVVYRAYELLKEGGEKDPAVLFETAMQNVGPTMEVRSRRVGGANYQVPVEVRAERRRALALRWIVGAARGKKGKPMHVKLAEEIKLGAEGQGEAIAKRDNTHKMAEANKAFAHFAW